MNLINWIQFGIIVLAVLCLLFGLSQSHKRFPNSFWQVDETDSEE